MHMVERGSYVAIMPTAASLGVDVLKIAPVILTGSVYIQLMDGRMFATIGGKSLAARNVSYIEPATHEHWDALHARTLQNA
jgi:hypothetical protein